MKNDEVNYEIIKEYKKIKEEQKLFKPLVDSYISHINQELINSMNKDNLNQTIVYRRKRPSISVRLSELWNRIKFTLGWT